jgi:hypothetical protein
MTTLTVTDLATGVWAAKVGTKLEMIGAGANAMHVEVRMPGEKRTVFLPSKWLDGLPTDDARPECGAAAASGTTDPPEPEVCAACGQVLPVTEGVAT